MGNKWLMIGLHILVLGAVVYLIEEMIDSTKAGVRGKL